MKQETTDRRAAMPSPSGSIPIGSLVYLTANLPDEEHKIISRQGTVGTVREHLPEEDPDYGAGFRYWVEMPFEFLLLRESEVGIV